MLFNKKTATIEDMKITRRILKYTYLNSDMQEGDKSTFFKNRVLLRFN